MTTTLSREESLLDALGIETLALEEQQQLMLDLGDLVFKGSLIRMMEQMDEHTAEALNGLIEANAMLDELQAFLQKNVPGADQAVADTVQELTDDILAVTGASQD